MAQENAVGVRLLLRLTGQQFRRWVPSKGLTRGHTRVEWLKTSTLGALLLTELIGTVAEHDALVVSDTGFGPVTADVATATESCARLVDLSSRHIDFRSLLKL